jgi:large subunit ribosomal protein L14
LQIQSKFRVADNTGAKQVQIKVLNKSKRRVARVGSHVVVTVSRAVYKENGLKEHEVHRGVVVRTRKKIPRIDGSFLQFDRNSGVRLIGRPFVRRFSSSLPPIVEIWSCWISIKPV